MLHKLTLAALSLIVCLASAPAQTPAFTIVQVAPTIGQPATSAPSAPAPPANAESALKLLQEMKAANEAILAKQTETLLRLEEIEKAAEQIKIYSKRT